jgi:hypothetical protein
MLQLMREALKNLHKSPNGEIGIMYEETDTYPKEYYCKTSNNAFLSNIIAICKATLIDSAPYVDKHAGKFQFLGTKAFFTDNL